MIGRPPGKSQTGQPPPTALIVVAIALLRSYERPDPPPVPALCSTEVGMLPPETLLSDASEIAPPFSGFIFIALVCGFAG
ncbi:MAG TPA: hypothetical protein VMT54_21720 [Candidatus Cybelea sp.]|nr:hypothetical protein [Candidatus Cybelea sp.]